MKRRKMSAYKKAQIKKKGKILGLVCEAIGVFVLFLGFLYLAVNYGFAVATNDYDALQWGMLLCVFMISVIFLLTLAIWISTVLKDFKEKDDKGDDDNE